MLGAWPWDTLVRHMCCPEQAEQAAGKRTTDTETCWTAVLLGTAAAAQARMACQRLAQPRC